MVDAYPQIMGALEHSKIDALALEFCGSRLDKKSLALCPSKTVLLGVVFNGMCSHGDHSAAMETPEEVRDALLDAADYLPPEQIQAAPDCGLVTLDQATARRKLAVMIKGAAMARAELGDADAAAAVAAM